MLKRSVKQAVSSSIGRVTASTTGRVVILCYHSIHPSLPFASASPDLFRAQLEWLVERSDIVSLSDVPALAGDATHSRVRVAITFDDGYRDNYLLARPELEAVGAPASFFVTAGLVDRDPEVVARMAALRRTSEAEVEGMTWGEVRELAEAGYDVGSHTWSHPVLALLEPADAARELRRSKERIEDAIGRPVTSLAYPFGKVGRHVSDTTAGLAERVGYEVATAVQFRGVRRGDSPFLLPRLFATQDDVDTLAAKVMGRWDWLGLWQEHAPRWLAQRVSPADFRDLAE